MYGSLKCAKLTGQAADEDKSPLAADGHCVGVVMARPHDGGQVLCFEVDAPRPEDHEMVEIPDMQRWDEGCVNSSRSGMQDHTT